MNVIKIFTITCFVFIYSAIAQAELLDTFLLKNYTEYAKELSGECTLKKAVVNINDDIASTDIEFEVQTADSYYISAWIKALYYGGKPRFEVYLDNQPESIGELSISKTGWQGSLVHKNNQPRKIYLESGSHINQV